MRTFAVIPAFNEKKTISRVVKRLPKGISAIVVDDGSVDNTTAIAKKAGAITLRHEENKGVGCAIRTGVKKAVELKASAIIVLNADLQHPPEAAREFLQQLKGCDAVFGERFTQGANTMPPLRKLGNALATFFFNARHASRLKDVSCGMRAYNKKAAAEILATTQAGYGIEVEIAERILRKKMRIKQLSIPCVYREGKGNSLKLFRQMMGALLLKN